MRLMWVAHTSRYKNKLAPVIAIASVIFLVLLHIVPFIQDLFQLAGIRPRQFWICLGVAFASVMWFEFYKALFVRHKL